MRPHDHNYVYFRSHLNYSLHLDRRAINVNTYYHEVLRTRAVLPTFLTAPPQLQHHPRYFSVATPWLFNRKPGEDPGLQPRLWPRRRSHTLFSPSTPLPSGAGGPGARVAAAGAAPGVGSPVAEAMGRGDHPAGAEQEASAVVLALEGHRHHVGPGVGLHLVAPDDPGSPGACRRGGTEG